jgi:hypothetical protein
MNRFIFRTAFVCLFTVVALCSCKKDEENKKNGGSAIVNNTITATVENGNSYNTQIDSVRVIIDGEDYEAANSVYKNGGFMLKLPETVNDTLINVLFGGDSIPSGVKVSDTTAKVGNAHIGAYKSGKKTGLFYHGTTEWAGQPIYATKNVTVTGSVIYDNKYTNKFNNMHLKKGWNIVYEKEISTGNGKTETEITTQVPNGAKWYYDVLNN